MKFEPVPTHVLTLLTFIATIALPAWIVARMVDSLAKTRERLHLQAWQLAQMTGATKEQR